MEETIDHLFPKCIVFGSLWYFFWQWLGVQQASPSHLVDHVQRFGNLGGYSKTY